MKPSTINIKLNDSASVSRGIDRLERFIEGLGRLDEAIKRLADIGFEVAKVDFQFAGAFYDGDPTVNVQLVKTKDGYQIQANGQAVCYLEFGAGVYYNGFGSYEGTIPDGIDRIGEHDTNGNTGVSMGARQAWGFRDTNGTVHITHGNPSANAMYHAKVAMEKQAEQIIKEVLFGD